MLRNTLNTFITATFIMLLGVSSSAQAIVPANSKITSSSSLTVEGLDPLGAFVTVTVNLQRSQPVIALKASDQPNPSPARWISGSTSELTYTYTITTTANGPATYTVSAAVTQDALSGAPGLMWRVDGKRLGATAAISNDGSEVTVPLDDELDNTINGISQGDTVVIDGRPYKVNSLTETAEGSTLTLDEDPGVLLLGTLIAEQQEFAVTLSDIVLADDAPNGQAENTLTVTATQEAFADDETNDQSFLVIELRAAEMQMYVRNTTDANPDPVPGEGNFITYPEGGDNNYFETDLVNTNPGDILEYLVTVRAGNDGPLTNREYKIPETDFLVYVEGSTYLNSGDDPIADDKSRAGFGLKHEGAEDDTIDTNETAYVTYQMTVMGGDFDRGDDVIEQIAETYFGCLLAPSPDGLVANKGCRQDGTPWAELIMKELEHPGPQWINNHTACWKGEADGQWVVGINRGDQSNAKFQARTRTYADLAEWGNDVVRLAIDTVRCVSN